MLKDMYWRSIISQPYSYLILSITSFGKILTSSAIIVIDNSRISKYLEYIDSDFNKSFLIKKEDLGSKWYFIENIEFKDNQLTFGELFKVSNSVATLSNKVFIIPEPENLDLEDEILKPAASVLTPKS